MVQLPKRDVGYGSARSNMEMKEDRYVWPFSGSPLGKAIWAGNGCCVGGMRPRWTAAGRQSSGQVDMWTKMMRCGVEEDVFQKSLLLLLFGTRSVELVDHYSIIQVVNMKQDKAEECVNYHKSNTSNNIITITMSSIL